MVLAGARSPACYSLNTLMGLAKPRCGQECRTGDHQEKLKNDHRYTA
jgi:hypothetical protein